MMRAMADSSVVWHDVECGGYAADLPLWRELAEHYHEPVLDLGAGTGRVSLDLARAGRSVTALDREKALLEALRERAAALGVEVRTVVGDIREIEIAETFGLILAPMQVMQLLSSRGERRAALRAAAARLAHGGVIAIAIVEGVPVAGETEPGSALPDVSEVGGWVYSSLPLEIVALGDAMAVTRLRQIVSPGGDLTEEVDEIRLAVLTADELEADAQSAGLRAVNRHEIPTTPAHVGSTVLLLEADSDA